MTDHTETETVQVFLRPGEVCLRIIRQDAGLCTRCGKQLAQAQFCWDHQITDRGPGYVWKLGDDPFTCLRHADGTTCGTDATGRVISHLYAKPVCSECGAVDQFDRRQEAYGDRVTCRICGDENYYSIGD